MATDFHNFDNQKAKRTENLVKSYANAEEVILDNTSADELEKGGKKAFIGEKRMFGGREYIRTKDGWKYHGKGTGSKAQEHAQNSSQSLAEQRNVHSLKVGDKVVGDNGKQGVVKTLPTDMTEMYNIDFGNGNVYGKLPNQFQPVTSTSTTNTNDSVEIPHQAALDKKRQEALDQIAKIDSYEAFYKRTAPQVAAFMSSDQFHSALKSAGFISEDWSIQGYMNDHVDYSTKTTMEVQVKGHMTGKNNPYDTSHYSGAERKRVEQKIENAEAKFQEATGMRLDINKYSFDKKDYSKGGDKLGLLSIYIDVAKLK